MLFAYVTSENQALFNADFLNFFPSDLTPVTLYLLRD